MIEFNRVPWMERFDIVLFERIVIGRKEGYLNRRPFSSVKLGYYWFFRLGRYSNYIETSVSPQSRPYHFSFSLQPDQWTTSEWVFNGMFRFSFLSVDWNISWCQTRAKEMIDRGIFYKSNTAPWAKGEKQ